MAVCLYLALKAYELTIQPEKEAEYSEGMKSA